MQYLMLMNLSGGWFDNPMNQPAPEPYPTERPVSSLRPEDQVVNQMPQPPPRRHPLKPKIGDLPPERADARRKAGNASKKRLSQQNKQFREEQNDPYAKQRHEDQNAYDRERLRKSYERTKEQKEESDVYYRRSPQFQLDDGRNDVEDARRGTLCQYYPSDKDDDAGGNQGGGAPTASSSRRTGHGRR